MRNLLFLLALVTLASCSSPKYTYHFDKYDYSNGKSKNAAKSEVDGVLRSAEVAPITASEQTLLASAADEVTYLPTEQVLLSDNTDRKFTVLTKEEKREIRKEAVKSIKEYVKAVKAGDNDKANEMAKGMDSDLRWAAIFGAAGIVSLIIGGDVFYIIGAVALIVGVVFFIKWLTRQ